MDDKILILVFDLSKISLDFAASYTQPKSETKMKAPGTKTLAASHPSLLTAVIACSDGG